MQLPDSPPVDGYEQKFSQTPDNLDRANALADNIGIRPMLHRSHRYVRFVWDIGLQIGGKYSLVELSVKIADFTLAQIGYEEHIDSWSQHIRHDAHGAKPKRNGLCCRGYGLHMLFDRAHPGSVKRKH